MIKMTSLAKDAALKRKMNSSIPAEFAMFPDIILQDTRDQYRNFYLFESHLQNPSEFHKQTLVQIEPQFFISMVEK